MPDGLFFLGRLPAHCAHLVQFRRPGDDFREPRFGTADLCETRTWPAWPTCNEELRVVGTCWNAAPRDPHPVSGAGPALFGGDQATWPRRPSASPPACAGRVRWMKLFRAGIWTHLHPVREEGPQCPWCPCSPGCRRRPAVAGRHPWPMASKDRLLTMFERLREMGRAQACTAAPVHRPASVGAGTRLLIGPAVSSAEHRSRPLSARRARVSPAPTRGAIEGSRAWDGRRTLRPSL